MFAALGTALAMTLPVQAQVQGNATAGEGKVAMCIGCHGIAGYKSSFPEVYRVPKIAGQSAKYIGTVLEEYRKGTRKHPSMRGIAGSMSDQDIADVAAYYEALGKVEGATELPAPREPSAQVAQLLQKGACVSCHGDNYSKPIDPSYPKIAGQYPDYLYAALRAYRDDSHATWGR
ncbi:MAG TPA: c-type cytochrome, partial [Ottowia sp.]|nr:c-type cytochrome [Ottowia sp.]